MTLIRPILTVQAAAGLAWEHRAAYLRLAAVPAAVSVGLLTLLLMLMPAAGHSALIDAQATPLPRGMTLMAMSGLGMASFAAILPVITAWHRFVILGQGTDPQWLTWRWRRTEWSYIWAMVKMCLAVLLVLMPLFIATIVVFVMLYNSGRTSMDPVVLGRIVGFAIGLLSMMLVFGAVLALPAAAVGRPITLRAAWRHLRGNFWRLVLALAILFVPSWVINQLITAVAAGTAPLPAFAISLVLTCLHFALIPLMVGVQSLAYLHTVGAPAAAPENV